MTYHRRDWITVRGRQNPTGPLSEWPTETLLRYYRSLRPSKSCMDLYGYDLVGHPGPQQEAPEPP